MSAICRVLHVGRATVYRAATPRTSRYAKADDRVLVAQLRTVLRERATYGYRRATYGYRRATALVNRHFGTAYNRKRVRRVMELNGWTLPVKTRRRNGRAHTGRVARDGSNERWCSDSLQVACWNGEVVEIGFALDCCDRECLAVVAEPRALSRADIRRLMHAAAAARFGEARPLTPVQWLSDNGGMYTALETVICAERLGLAPVTTCATGCTCTSAAGSPGSPTPPCRDRPIPPHGVRPGS